MHEVAGCMLFALSGRTRSSRRPLWQTRWMKRFRLESMEGRPIRAKEKAVERGRPGRTGTAGTAQVKADLWLPVSVRGPACDRYVIFRGSILSQLPAETSAVSKSCHPRSRPNLRTLLRTGCAPASCQSTSPLVISDLLDPEDLSAVSLRTGPRHQRSARAPRCGQGLY